MRRNLYKRVYALLVKNPGLRTNAIAAALKFDNEKLGRELSHMARRGYVTREEILGHGEGGTRYKHFAGTRPPGSGNYDASKRVIPKSNSIGAGGKPVARGVYSSGTTRTVNAHRPGPRAFKRSALVVMPVVRLG